MEKSTVKIGKKWLSIWLYVITLVSGIILGVTACKWNIWNLQERLYALAAALLPLHVLEEWLFPGGFHTMYNLMANSDTPDRYPMNQISDMWTNTIGIVMDCIILFIGVNPFFCVMKIVLCLGEACGHTYGAIFSYRRFKNQGKRTPYNPGFLTTWLGFVPICIGLLVSFRTVAAPTPVETIIAIIVMLVLGAFAVNGMDHIFRDPDTPYPFTWGNGYFDKYLITKEHHETN